MTPRAIVDIRPEDLRGWFQAKLTAGYRLALVAAHRDPESWRLVYLLMSGPPASRLELHVRLPLKDPVVPSLADLSYPAGRFEREMQDLFGIVPEGHPNPAPLVRHQPEDTALRPTVEGPGVYEIPVGPVHAGLIEPGHFRFSVVGETILDMQPQLWFVRKGIEALFEGRDVEAGLGLAERISGDTTVGHALAYCLAVEEASGTSVPTEASVLRAVVLELERLYNHVGDIGALCNDVGFGIVHAHTLRIREQLLRINKRVTGHRLLRGTVMLGGARVEELIAVATLEAVAEDLHEVVDIALANSTVVDRFTGTAVLGRDHAQRIGTLGCVARASGLASDARQVDAFAPLYASLRVPVHQQGDVLARFRIRVDEFDSSVALLTTLLRDAVAGTHGSSPVAPGRESSGVGVVEGWRGTIVHRVELSPAGTLSRVKVVDPSFFNWPALPMALADTIVPDFPLANKSFNLSYAGNDL